MLKPKEYPPLESSCERSLFIICGFFIHELTPVVFKTACTIKLQTQSIFIPLSFSFFFGFRVSIFSLCTLYLFYLFEFFQYIRRDNEHGFTTVYFNINSGICNISNQDFCFYLFFVVYHAG